MGTKATIKDVAKLAGVSFKTVSRVINNEPSVGEVIKKKVEKAIKELHYQPNLSARHLRGAPASIGFIYDNPNSNYVIEMQHGILAECRRQGYELVIHPCDAKSKDIGEELRQMVMRSQVGGLIITPPLSEMPAIIDMLAKLNLKLVRIISGSYPDDLTPCVFINDREAAFNLTQHLIKLGHKDIGFLCGDDEHSSSGERLEGYKAALTANKIPIKKSLIIPGHYSFDSGVEGTTRLLGKSKPTAIFSSNDEIAAGALFAARKLGFEVPDDLSIVGFEDSPFARQTWPRLTTAHQSNSEIAQSAAALLIANMRPAHHAKDAETQSSYGFNPRLVVRESTTAIN